MNKKIKVCSRCVMDKSVSNIHFDKNGYCNYCIQYSKSLKDDGTFIEVENLETFINKIKWSGRNKKYNCIVGVSGGADSSWALLKAKKFGLKPLAVHMDNGWNSELAQSNIQGLIESLDVDLYTYVINWEEYRDLMQAFFDADVIDVELLYDNAMIAVNYRMAKKYGIKYILSGSNSSTERMMMPPNWNWFKYDKTNIYDIYKNYTSKKIKTFPTYSSLDLIIDTYIRNIKWVPFLDFFNYKKELAMNELNKFCGFKKYPYKHYESIFTRFYQGHILPKKFNVDKRKLHLSTLILSGQMDREKAILDLKEISYPHEKELEVDKEYFLKKMKWSNKELDLYLNRPEISHDSYKSEKKFWVKMNYIGKKILPKGIINFLKKRRLI